MSQNEVITQKEYEGTNLFWTFRIDNEDFTIFNNGGVYQLEGQNGSRINLLLNNSYSLQEVADFVIEKYGCENYD
jgi:hypothetical protein